MLNVGRERLAQSFHLPKRNFADWLMGNPTAIISGTVTICHFLIIFFLFILMSMKDAC